MKNTLLYGWYNSCNLGDDAIFLIVADYLDTVSYTHLALPTKA